ncbi:MAG: spermidine synthase, partial [Gammaproteobacteria bacterium]
HHRGLFPVSKKLSSDLRTTFYRDDFFELAANKFTELSPDGNNRRYHAILLDIDHSPNHVLQPGNRAFYTSEGLTRLRDCLHESGVFALWSNDKPEKSFASLLSEIFLVTTTHVVGVDNPLTGKKGDNTIYLARC